MHQPRWVLLVLSASLLAGIGVLACDVPVFRWALEHWGAQGPHDCYEATVFHRGVLDDASRTALEALERRAWPQDGAANLVVRTVDVTEAVGPKDEELWESLREKPLPRVALRYPPVSRITVPVWDGALDAGLAERLVDSPLRRKISKHVLDGRTAAWILVESGDSQKDAAAAKTLAESLKKLEETLEIHEPEDIDSEWQVVETGGGPTVPEEGAPGAGAQEKEKEKVQRPSFAVERVARSDAGEEVLLRMLLRSESDLEEAIASKPICFPVFGRGRFLYALVGDGITMDNIDEPCTYLVGMCSCEVKWQNPGLDILMQAKWQVDQAAPSLAPSQAVSLVAPPAPDSPVAGPPSGPAQSPASAGGGAPSQAPSTRAADVPATRGALLRSVALTVGGLLVVAGLVALIVISRRSSR